MAFLCYLLHFPSLKRIMYRRLFSKDQRAVENAIVQFLW